MSWSLDQVRDLEIEEFHELSDWLNEQGKPADERDSTDMDAFVKARTAKDDGGD